MARRRNQVVRRVAELEVGAGVALAEEPSLAGLFKIVDGGPPYRFPDTPVWHRFVADFREMAERAEAQAAAEGRPWPSE